MAQQETDREDLLREATALVQRCELQILGFAESVVLGFRRDGSASVFCGAEPVYQFNIQNQLRRGYRQGSLLKGDQGRLIRLTRERMPTQVLLVRAELLPAEQDAILAEVTQVLKQLCQSLASGQYTLVGQVPAEGKLPELALAWLQSFPFPVQIASTPNVG